MKMKTGQQKTYACSKNSSKREVQSDTSLPQETRKISNKQPKLTPKATRERTNKTQVSRRKEITKMGIEKNKDQKKTIEKINAIKTGSLKR